jgi:hypothetical protein
MEDKEKAKLVAAVQEDVNIYLSAEEREEITEFEMVAWRSGYVAGYNRRKIEETEVEEES